MHVLIYLYQSIVQPQLDYAIWGFISQHNIYTMHRLQNRTARIITGNFDYVHVKGIDSNVFMECIHCISLAVLLRVMK